MVPPLTLPDLRRLPEPEVLAHVAAVRLFVLRVQAIQPAFALTAANAGTIAAICVWLDGLPLALELAAARIKLFPPEALLARLSHRLEILTGGARDVPTRQQTLRATLQWSYDLLSAEEQRLFRRLAVFVDGCALEATALCRLQGDLEGDMINVVASLLDKSMVLQTELEGKEPRLRLLATVREFAWEKLSYAGELEAMRQAHAAHYLYLAEAAAPHLFSAEQMVWLERLERDHENLQAALGWFQEQKECKAVLRLCAALWPFWWIHGHLNEGEAQSESALAAPAPHIRLHGEYSREPNL